MENRTCYTQRIGENEGLIGSDELEDIPTKIVSCEFSEGVVQTDGCPGNFECNIDDSECHDTHGISMLTIMWVKQRDEDAKELPN